MTKPATCLLLAALHLTGAAQSLTIEVKNPTEDFRHEVVEVSADSVTARVGQHFRVTEAAGLDVAYQLTYDGRLLIEAAVRPRSTARFKVVAGQAPAFATVCHGAVHPERKDDMAWENDRGCYRVYGPALGRTGERSYGIDVWTKNTPELVVDERYRIEDIVMMPRVDSLRRLNRQKGDSLYRINSYHHDHGRGLDPYKVGSTLGCGAPALMLGDSILMPYVFSTCTILDDGPLRFTAELTQVKAKVGSAEVTEHRRIQLDKQSNFNRMTVWYDGLHAVSQRVSLCSGVVIQREDPLPVVLGKNYVSYTDPTDQPLVHQAPLYVAALFPNGTVQTRQFNGHAIGILSNYDGEPYTYYFGSAWSKYDVRTPEEWAARISWFLRGLQQPLQVTLK